MIANSGRVSLAFEKSHQCADIEDIKSYKTSSVSLDGLPLQRDAFLISLIHEDRAVREVREKGWESDLGKSIHNDHARRSIFSVYQQEAKFRDARAAFYKKTMENLSTFNSGDVEDVMERWDAEHTYERDHEIFSPFRQQAMRQAAVRAEREKAADAKLGKGKGIAVEVKEVVEPEIKEAKKVEPQPKQ